MHAGGKKRALCARALTGKKEGCAHSGQLELSQVLQQLGAVGALRLIGVELAAGLRLALQRVRAAAPGRRISATPRLASTHVRSRTPAMVIGTRACAEQLAESFPLHLPNVDQGVLETCQSQDVGNSGLDGGTGCDMANSLRGLGARLSTVAMVGLKEMAE